MSYDYYRNTPFDLNGDGYIDPGEASYIHDTLQMDGKSNSSNGSGGQKLRKSNPVPWIIFFIVCIVFSSSPGIILFVGAMLFSAKLSRIF